MKSWATRDRNIARRLLGIGLVRLQLERDGVDAVALTSGHWTIIEDVSQVPAAGLTRNLRPDHSIAHIHVKIHGVSIRRLGEARPTGMRVELGVLFEQL